MRWSFVLVVAALVAYLAAAARFDPALPFLFNRGTLSWWVLPDPALTAKAPETVRYTFTPPRAGTLLITAMSRFELREGDRVLARGPVTPDSWKKVVTVAVPARVLVVEAVDDHRLPALGLGGEAAPRAVTASWRGSDVAAVDAGSALDVKTAFGFAPLRLAGRAAVLVLVLAAMTLGWRRTTATLAPLPPRKALVGVILGLHLLLTLWNVARFPITRGLDAAGHIEYAQLIADEGRLPAPGRGWQTYHPPLYYALAAIALRLTGSDRSLQALSAALTLALLVVVARSLGPTRWRGLLLVAFLPVLLVTEPQATNETMVALLFTAVLAVATTGTMSAGRAALVGLLAGLALLTKYTGVFAVAASLVAIALVPATAARRVRWLGIALVVAAVVGGAPYLERYRLYGDPFVGNWDDVLGQSYRQPPGFRTAAYYLDFGVALFAHPAEARNASFWDALYVSTFSDGFGRIIATPLQHHLLGVLAWMGLPLALVTLGGLLAPALSRRRPTPLEGASVALATLMIPALIRYSLELPYWSAVKGVFLLGMALPAAAGFERGRAAVAAHGGPRLARLLDLDLVAFAATAAIALAYRSA